MLTVLEVIKKSTEFLAGKGVESARHNAESLVGHALGLPRMQLYLQFERPLTEPELERIRPLVRRRAGFEPLQYIVGETDFSGLKLKVDRRALIPRPETEYLVELLVAELGGQFPQKILDLGTGTGAIALALAKYFPQAQITAVDQSEAALSLARENAERLGPVGQVRFLHSNWFSAVPAGEFFDVIVSNPPYLSAAETAETAAEVREFEPQSALTSGEDGLADLRQIIALSPRFLAAAGLLALETGIAQHAALGAIFRENGFGSVQSRQDLTKRDRFVFARK